MTKPAPNFDFIARPYRWFEYLTFGPYLERCRFSRLPEITGARRALVIGDGDGRFLTRLLQSNPDVLVDVIDLSPGMLKLLEQRVRNLGTEAHSRVAIHRADVRDFSPPESFTATGYDLVVTHFFLDCLTHLDLSRLTATLRPHLVPGARWLVSEFQVPEGGIVEPLSRFLVRSLYRAFGILTGLEVRELPAWDMLLERSGFSRFDERSWLGGLLTSEIWTFMATSAAADDSYAKDGPSFSPAGPF
ncbi:class I SAM-dependent methyltransferase [Paracidobacterium acidisoli]|nr:class I SAM-dependent methyltransferase [Paracidobacterium acidisoli]MBT9331012.1 class I SAM-dependent methyltransferase [Paracidobacterium acidisoli]